MDDDRIMLSSTTYPDRDFLGVEASNVVPSSIFLALDSQWDTIHVDANELRAAIDEAVGPADSPLTPDAITAAQEPTDGEVLAALNAQGIVVSPKMHPAPSLDYWGDKPAEAMRAALSAARAARREEEKR